MRMPLWPISRPGIDRALSYRQNRQIYRFSGGISGGGTHVLDVPEPLTAYTPDCSTLLQNTKVQLHECDKESSVGNLMQALMVDQRLFFCSPFRVLLILLHKYHICSQYFVIPYSRSPINSRSALINTFRPHKCTIIDNAQRNACLHAADNICPYVYSQSAFIQMR